MPPGRLEVIADPPPAPAAAAGMSASGFCKCGASTVAVGGVGMGIGGPRATSFESAGTAPGGDAVVRCAAASGSNSAEVSASSCFTVLRRAGGRASVLLFWVVLSWMVVAGVPFRGPAESEETASAGAGAAAAAGAESSPTGSDGDGDASRRAAIVASLRRSVEEWDGSDQEAAEAMIVSLLKHDLPLELGTIVSHILFKVHLFPRGERILDRLGAHTFDMTPAFSYHLNVWWSAGSCEFMTGPVGVAALRLAPTWVEKLLSHLRAGGQPGELTNEVAVATSTLSLADGLSTSVQVERLTKILRMLLAAGCDVNAKAGGFTALHYVASAVTREEVDDEERAKWIAPATEMDALLTPLCELLVEHGARFDVYGDYGNGHKYDAARKYRGWTPPLSGSSNGGAITPPHPTATALDMFVARGWRRCVDAVLQTSAKPPGSGVCVGGEGLRDARGCGDATLSHTHTV